MADNLLPEKREDLPQECAGKSKGELETCLSHLVMDDLYKGGGSFNSALVPVDDSVLANQAAPAQKIELPDKGLLQIPAIRGYDSSQGLNLSIGSGNQPFNSAGADNRVINSSPTVSSGGGVNLNYHF